MQTLRASVPPERTTRQTLAERHADANCACARIILSDRKRYAGLPLLWAEAVLRGGDCHERQPAAWRLVA